MTGLPALSVELRHFLRSLRSLWAIELLLILYRAGGQPRSIDDLVIELRSSRTLVDGIIARLHMIGLVTRQSDGSYAYCANSPSLNALVEQLSHLYAERPLTLAQEVHGEPDQKLRTFSDAFRLKGG